MRKKKVPETKFNTRYERVIPRDLFNEGKLLKCVGRLALLIHERNTPVDIQILEDVGYMDQGFRIGLWEDGYLSIYNMQIRIKDIPHTFRTVYNSKANYPLYAFRDNTETLVFDEAGNWDQEFIDYCNTL